MTAISETTAEKIGLNWVLGQLEPISPYGVHLKQRMRLARPGCESWLAKEWDSVVRLLQEPDQELLAAIRSCLANFREIRGALKAACQGQVLADTDFFDLKRFISLCRCLKEAIEPRGIFPRRLAIPLADQLESLLAVGGVGEGFYLADGFSPILAELRTKQRALKTEISQRRRRLKAEIAAETGKEFSLLGRLRLSKLDPACRLLTAHKHVSVVAEGFAEIEYALRDDEPLLALIDARDQLESKIEGAELSVRQRLTARTAKQRRLLLAACRRIGRIDLLLAKERLAQKIGWCRPELTTLRQIALTGFKNPLVAGYLEQEGYSFQPVTLALTGPVTVITGANMGGKTVALCSLGLAIAMAQLGLLVPAKACSFMLRDFIYYSQQGESLSQGLSAFGAEIHSLAQVLPRRDQRGLLLLDEPARGTNPAEGAALVKAIALWLKKGECISVVATHFSELARLPGVSHLRVAGLSLAGQDIKDISLADLPGLMDYSLVPGAGEVPKEALTIAAFLGLVPEIIALAAQEMGVKPPEVL